MSDEQKKSSGVVIIALAGAALLGAACFLIWFAVQFSRSTTVIEDDGSGHIKVKMTVGDQKK